MNLRQHLKFTARGFLSHAKPSPLLIGLGALGIMTLLQILSSEVTNETERVQALYSASQQFLQNNNTEYYMNAIMSNQPTFVQNLLSALLSMMVMMVSTGIIIYVISEARYHKGSFGNLLDGLPILLRVVWYQIISTVLISLWSMLFIIPGIIASYRYRQGLYILLDHPEMSVMECIRASKHMMDGHKMELLIIDLSFFGWIFAESMLSTSLTALFGASYLPSLFVLPLSAFVRMYMEFTLFLYYEHLCGVHYDSRIPNIDPVGQ